MMVNQRLYEEHERERQSLNRNPYNCKLVKELPDGTRLYKLGFWIFKVSVVVSKDNGLWHLSISGNRRKPSPRQVFIAQSELIPLDIKMEIRDGAGLDPSCIHLFQVSGTNSEAIKWIEGRGYVRSLHEGDGWYKGAVFIPFSYLPEESGAAQANIHTLKDFMNYVIGQEK
ncbi:hypothetical protein [Paenibacillus taichungensis]